MEKRVVRSGGIYGMNHIAYAGQGSGTWTYNIANSDASNFAIHDESTYPAYYQNKKFYGFSLRCLVST